MFKYYKQDWRLGKKHLDLDKLIILDLGKHMNTRIFLNTPCGLVTEKYKRVFKTNKLYKQCHGFSINQDNTVETEAHSPLEKFHKCKSVIRKFCQVSELGCFLPQTSAIVCCQKK